MFAMLLVVLPSFFTMQATIESLTDLQTNVTANVSDINSYKNLSTEINSIQNESIKKVFLELFDTKVVAHYTLEIVNETLAFNNQNQAQVNISQKAAEIATAINDFEKSLTTKGANSNQQANATTIIEIATTSLKNIETILTQVGKMQDSSNLTNSTINGLTLTDFFNLSIKIENKLTTIKDYIIAQIEKINKKITIEIETKAQSLQNALTNLTNAERPNNNLLNETKASAKSFINSIFGFGISNK